MKIKENYRIFFAFCVSSAVWSMILLLYAIWVLWNDVRLSRLRGVHSRTRMPLICMVISLVAEASHAVMSAIFYAVETGYINDEEVRSAEEYNDDVDFESAEIFGRNVQLYDALDFLNIMIPVFVTFSLVSVAVPSIESMALAFGGVQASRKTWIVAIRYVFWFVIAAGVLAFSTYVLVFSPIMTIPSTSKTIGRVLLWAYVSIPNIYSPIVALILALFYGVLSFNFFIFARDGLNVNGRALREPIRTRCGEIFRVSSIFSICILLMSGFQLYGAFSSFELVNLEGVAMLYVSLGILSFTFIVDMDRVISRNIKMLEERSGRKWRGRLLSSGRTSSLSSIRSSLTFRPSRRFSIIRTASIINIKENDEYEGEFIMTNTSNVVLGHVVQPERPTWLPKRGTEQASYPPQQWTITIENFLKFLRECISTDTWTGLSRAKGGEGRVTMYDINNFFITPWTKGTGCSVGGCLMHPHDRTDNNDGVEAMISHAWGGSVLETISSIESLVTLHYLPKETRIFFCTICMYQPNDDVPGGLSVEAQVELDPFAKVIALKPKYGMFVIHTTLYEIYDRLWCVHEVSECLLQGIDIHAIFDSNKWTEKSFREIVKDIDTEKAECSTEKTRS